MRSRYLARNSPDRLPRQVRGVHGSGNSHSHGIPMGFMGFPWDSHGNGSSFGLLMGMGMGIGIVLMGMGIAYFIREK